MRDEKEERKKQARSNKQTRQSNTAHPHARVSLYPDYMYMHVSQCTQSTCTCTCLSVPRLHVHARVSVYPDYMYMYMYMHVSHCTLALGVSTGSLMMTRPSVRELTVTCWISSNPNRSFILKLAASSKKHPCTDTHTHTHMYMSCYMNTNLVCPHTVYKPRPTAAE